MLNMQNFTFPKKSKKLRRQMAPQAQSRLTENYYIVNSETIMDVNNYIPFSITNSRTIDVM